MKRHDFDTLVLGSGIAGLSFALKASQHGSVAIVTKKDRAESNTNYAQGGIACVWDEKDTFEDHVQDTLKAGDGLCDEQVVRGIVSEGPARIQELIHMGMEFARRTRGDDEDGYDLGMEGGHSKRRVLHAGDLTGREVEKALLANIASNPHILVFENHIAVDLITLRRLGLAGSEDRCLGAYVLDIENAEVNVFAAPVTLLATGGAGKVYLYTSNPDIASGDGIAMGWRAYVPVANMEFFQFHPTCLYDPKAKSFLISEAVRGEGAILKRKDGTPFMEEYHAMKDLAPRDVVARAIDNEMKVHGDDYVFLDITHKQASEIRARFPNIYETCLSYGYDMATQPIPVVPAAHYCCGGVRTQPSGSTGIRGLYACGETACTGLHGANRLASNSLLEALVIAHRAAEASEDELKVKRIKIPAWESGKARNSDEEVVISHNWEEIRRLMWDYVGIVRTNKRLERAHRRILNIQKEISKYYWDFTITSDLIELRNLATVAQLIVESARKRKESRGLHYNLDCPGRDDRYWKKFTVLKRKKDQVFRSLSGPSPDSGTEKVHSEDAPSGSNCS